MIMRRASLGRFPPRLLAALLVMLLPAAAPAETLIFHNRLKESVFVQASSVFRGMLKRDRARLVKPGDKTRAISLPGDKIIVISDPFVPNKVLYQGAVPAGRMDLHYDIVLDGTITPAKVTIRIRKPSSMRPRP